jgi:hypothetical protein
MSKDKEKVLQKRKDVKITTSNFSFQNTLPTYDSTDIVDLGRFFNI